MNLRSAIRLTLTCTALACAVQALPVAAAECQASLDAIRAAAARSPLDAQMWWYKENMFMQVPNGDPTSNTDAAYGCAASMRGLKQVVLKDEWRVWWLEFALKHASLYPRAVVGWHAWNMYGADAKLAAAGETSKPKYQALAAKLGVAYPASKEEAGAYLVKLYDELRPIMAADPLKPFPKY